MSTASTARLSHWGGMEGSGVKPAGYAVVLSVDHFPQVLKISECDFPSYGRMVRDQKTTDSCRRSGDTCRETVVFLRPDALLDASVFMWGDFQWFKSSEASDN